MKRNDEDFYKQLAKAYMEREGTALQNEWREMEQPEQVPSCPGLDRKIKRKATAYRIRRYSLRVLPFAASLIILLLVYRNMPVPHTSSSDSDMSASMPGSSSEDHHSNDAINDNPSDGAIPADNLSEDRIPDALSDSVRFVSTRLPERYRVVQTDYDHQTAVMVIVNEELNRITLTMEAYRPFIKEDFTELTVNGKAVYGLVRNDYCMLKYQKGEMTYTLTSAYNYLDLIEIGKNII